MKWIFIILVALNLIVFGGVVAQRMLLPAPQTVTERTIMVEKKVDSSTKKIEEAPKNQIQEEKPTKTQSQPEKQTEKIEKPEKTEKITTKASPKNKPKPAQKLAEKPKKAPVQKASNTTSTPSRKQKCGGASVTLPENVYHRIKGLLNEWPNAATREVGKKQGKSQSQSNEYVVIITPSAQQNEHMMVLIGKGFKPRQDKGLVVLGQFTNRKAADALRQRVLTHGVRANVMERHQPGKAGLSQANYRVLFMKINDADARKLSGILKPYAPLRRNPCK